MVGDLLSAHLKNRILVQDSVFASRLRRDKRGTNPVEKGGRPKDIFEMGSTKKALQSLQGLFLK
jgi:hypothetical protein